MDSLKRGHKKINLLIGGSATNDGGIGLANALGYEFVDKNGIRLKPVGKNLISIKNITKYGQFYKNKFSSSSINVYTDVTNVFTGINGATRIYGPQKGATPSAI
jgi:glycerate 2-kinase